MSTRPGARLTVGWARVLCRRGAGPASRCLLGAWFPERAADLPLVCLRHDAACGAEVTFGHPIELLPALTDHLHALGPGLIRPKPAGDLLQPIEAVVPS